MRASDNVSSGLFWTENCLYNTYLDDGEAGIVKSCMPSDSKAPLMGIICN